MAVPSPTAREATVSFEGAELAYETVGTGDPVVLVHGLGASAVIWADLRERLGHRFRVVVPDLRAAGRTIDRDGRELSLTRWAEDIRAVVEAAEVERPVIVGHSLGASVALAYALRWPADVRALVLMAADPNLSHLAPRMHRNADLIERLGLAAWVENHWSQNPPFSQTSLARSPEILERYRAMVLANDPDSYRRVCLAIAEADDLTGRLGEIDVPALVIAGGEDDRTLPEANRKLAAALPQADLVELADVGHTPPFEAPDEVARAVAEFVGRT